jgi:acyl-CoA reductase-like NAD-dependent aldehyde dehydrogenase
VVSRQQFDTVLGYAEAGKREGARLVAGGQRAEVGNAKATSYSPRSSPA